MWPFSMWVSKGNMYRKTLCELIDVIFLFSYRWVSFAIFPFILYLIRAFQKSLCHGQWQFQWCVIWPVFLQKLLYQLLTLSVSTSVFQSLQYQAAFLPLLARYEQVKKGIFMAIFSIFRTKFWHCLKKKGFFSAYECTVLIQEYWCLRDWWLRTQDGPVV